MSRSSSSSSSSSSSDDDLRTPVKTASAVAPNQNEKSFQALETKYHTLLDATAKLVQRTIRRHTSLKDLERSVLYLRSLYNQIIPPEPQQPSTETPAEDADGDVLDDEFMEKWVMKRTFMVECDKERRFRKREDKAQEKRRKQKEIWERWRQERLQILESERQLAIKANNGSV